LVKLAPRDARAGARLRGHRGRPARHRSVREADDGYDTGTFATDLVTVMERLGHERFAIVGVDTGMLIAYAVAADYPSGSNVVVHGVVGEERG
jgi:pimeloyl-ACP methyl ester carboxylesterase